MRQRVWTVIKEEVRQSNSVSLTLAIHDHLWLLLNNFSEMRNYVFLITQNYVRGVVDYKRSLVHWAYTQQENSLVQSDVSVQYISVT